MEILPSKLENIKIIKPPTIFEDFRGSWVETYNEQIYQQADIEVKFLQDDVSTSRKGVLRGIHGDNRTWKLLSCLYGRIYLVVVDCREGENFGKWDSFTISDSNRLQVLVPPGHGVGHLVMSNKAVLGYKQSTYYDRASQFTYRWNDERFAIHWPVKNPILSDRDRKGM